jgi:chemotaxis protein histidine kinase CheA
MNSFADNLAGNAARVEQELARVSARLDAQQHAVDVQLAQAQKELTSLRNSLSWRLTAPLRGIASRIRRIVS